MIPVAFLDQLLDRSALSRTHEPVPVPKPLNEYLPTALADVDTHGHEHWVRNFASPRDVEHRGRDRVLRHHDFQWCFFMKATYCSTPLLMPPVAVSPMTASA